MTRIAVGGFLHETNTFAPTKATYDDFVHGGGWPSMTHGADVLVADEAVSALNVSVQAQVLDLLDEIQRRLGIALLFITHDLRVAAQICDDVAVMQHGRVVEQGPAAEVLTNPQQAYTRALIDAAPGRGWDFANFRPVSEGIGATA